MTELRVAVLANRKYGVKVCTGAPPDALAEYDVEETIVAIQDALRARGHKAFFLEADETLLATVRDSRPDFCFNVAEGLRGDSRESQVPAVLEWLNIPYTGSKVLTHAISLDKAVASSVLKFLPTRRSLMVFPSVSRVAKLTRKARSPSLMVSPSAKASSGPLPV